MPVSLFDRLKISAASAWESYVDHPFVKQMAAGTLPADCFRHYLTQDYLFLVHFVRAYGLAIYKADTLQDMRAAAATAHAILDTEMQLHVKLCAGWGIAAADLEAVPEASATIAYTRFVLERGMAGDLLDLQVALSPCVIGYGEIARRITDDPLSQQDDNPYWPWVEEYAGDAYGVVADAARETLDRLAEQRLSDARFPALVRTFERATRLEAAFWQMGLDIAW